jgi:hypothetical protein
MREIICKNCKYFKPYSAEDDRGECRKHAPIISVHGLSRWPLVREEEWCGDFEKKELTDGK